MEDKMTKNGLLRMVGVMAIGVGIAWVVQIFAFSHSPAALARFAWVVAAAAVSGAGAGLVVTAGTLPQAEQSRV